MVVETIEKVPALIIPWVCISYCVPSTSLRARLRMSDVVPSTSLRARLRIAGGG